MIPRTVPTWQIKNWQDELQQLITTPEALLAHLELNSDWLPAAQKASEQFSLRVTHSFANRMRKGDPYDPLLRQVLPLAEELQSAPEFTADPLLEQQFSPCPGLIHKYESRVLLIAATQCAINCRYCFRRHFPYDDNQRSRTQWSEAFEYIANAPNINEVILSGGDPLSLSDRQLSWFTYHIGQINHIKRLRIHSRYPIILPNRITDDLLISLRHERLQTVMVSHCNHPQEIDDQVGAALQKIRDAGILSLNQTVLLRNINDNSNILTTLSETLFAHGVLPYYLHLLDPVSGAAHFLVGERQAKAIYKQLLAALPGYLVPKLVRETAHEPSKTPVGFI